MAETSPHHSQDECTTGGDNSGHPIGARGGGDDKGIPVVDFDVLINGAGEQRSRAIRDLGRACEDWGFFMVINHGVPEDLKAAMMEACGELFGFPRKEKAEYLKAGPMDPVRIGSGFYAVVDGAGYWRDFLEMFAHPELHCPPKPERLKYHTSLYLCF